MGKSRTDEGVVMDDRYNFYKDQYFFELQRKQNLASNLSIPIGFLTIIFSSYAYFGLNIHTLIVNWTLIPIAILLSFSIFFTIKATYILYKTFTGLKYGYVPNIKEIRAYETKLKEHLSAKSSDYEKALNQKFFNNIKDSLVNTTSNNRINNNSRSNNLHLININTFYSIIFIILTSIPFFTNKYQSVRASDEIKFTIKSKELLKMIQDDDPKDGYVADDDSDGNDEPVFPSDEYINESAEIYIPQDIPDTTEHRENEANSESE